MITAKANLLFEVSWEVCNKVGGIYTVIKSKTERIMGYYNDGSYYAIGPYFADRVAGQFDEKPVPEQFNAAYEELKSQGIILHFGTWLIKGQPHVILIDFQNVIGMGDEIKGNLWNDFQVNSMSAGYDYTEPVVFSWTAGRVIERLSKDVGDKKIVAHFHEWLVGPGLLYLKKSGAKVATVFTTHATILGRTLASNNVDLYNVMDKINPDEEASRYGIDPKFGLEKASALNADCFTTVSEITGIEAEHLLGRKPDHLLPNGLDLDRFPTFEDIAVEHQIKRDRIRKFLVSYFYPYYTFDMDNTLIYFLAGRYEFRDKGIDVFLKALDILNEKLIEEKSNKTVVAFIWVPSGIKNIKPVIINNLIHLKDIDNELDDYIPTIKRKLLTSLTAEQKVDEENLFSEKFALDIRKKVMKFKTAGNPPLCTHDLHDGNDTILDHAKATSLDNDKDDKVKIIFYPTYLTGADGLLDLNYNECMQASHLGVFPSFYEPWGYTPLEAAALGVSSVTTDLAGFGRYISKETGKGDTPGVFVLKRMGRSEDQIVNDLAAFLHTFANYSKQDRIANKMVAKKISNLADWKNLIQEYIHAHNFAIDKVYGNKKKK